MSPQTEPRTRLLVAAAAVVCVAATPVADWPRFAAEAALLAAALWLARVPARTLRRAAVPTAWCAVFGAVGVALGAPAAQAATFCVRIALSTGICVALSASTPYTQIVAALAWFRVPSLATQMLLLVARYLSVFADEGGRMGRAFRCRALGRQPWAQAVALGKLSACLLERAVDRSERVADAMLARGFDGHFPAAPLPPLRRRDALLASAVSVALVALGAAHR